MSALVISTLVMLAQDLPVQGKAGALDRTFGDGGRVALGRFQAGEGMAIRKDGRIVLAGSSGGRFAVARFRRDGRLDRSFGGDGVVQLRNTSPGCVGVSSDVHVLADGRTLAIGQVGGTFEDGGHEHCGQRQTIAMYLPDGHLDPSFGSDGVVMGPAVSCGNADLAGGRLQDGRIVAAGFGCDDDVTVVRLRADGSPDPTFGGGEGRVEVTALEGIWAERMDLAVQPDGKVVIVSAAIPGAYGEGVPVTRFAVIRVDVDGSFDSTFGGGDGIVTTSFRNKRCTAAALASAVAIGKDGKVVVGGWASCRDPGEPLPHPRLAFVRLTPDGRLDQSFADAGRARILLPVEKGMDYVYRLAIQPDGRIVAVGTNGKALVVRLRSNGRLDRSFGRDGMLQAWRNGFATSLAIAGTVRIDVAGGRFGAESILACYLAS